MYIYIISCAANPAGFLITPRKIGNCFQEGIDDIYLIIPGFKLFYLFWGSPPI